MNVIGGNRLNRETLYLPNDDIVNYEFIKVGTRVTLADMCGVGNTVGSQTELPIKRIQGRPKKFTWQGWSAVKAFPAVDLSQVAYDSLGMLFMYCAAVEDVNLNDYNWKENPLFKDATYDAGIYYSTFMGCAALKSLVIPFRSGINWMFYNSLSGCTSLENITFDCDNDTLQFSSNASFSSCPLNEQTLLQLADKLAYVSGGVYPLELQQATAEVTMDKYVKQNADGNLEICESTDPDALGTLSQYITDKGWTVSLV